MFSALTMPLLAQAPAASESPPAEEGAVESIDEQLLEVPDDPNEALDVVLMSLGDMWGDFLARLPLFVVALVVLLITGVVASVASRCARISLTKARLRRSLKDLIRQVLYLTIWVIGLLVAAVVVFPGMTPAKVLTVLGLGSIAIGFAFKDIVENFFAGVLILWRFPFESGDYIECNDIRGRVEETTIRMTTIRQVDGQLVVLPNAQLFKSPVFIVTSQPNRRITSIVGVDYTSDLEHARGVIASAVEKCDSVDKNRPVEIFCQEFAGSSINFEVTWWCGSTPLEVRESRDQVLRRVKSALDREGISIPFPHRTLTFKEPLPLAGETSDSAAGSS